jgi:hypothetical protein
MPMSGTARLPSGVLCGVPAQTLLEVVTTAGLRFAMSETTQTHAKSLRTGAVRVAMEGGMAGAPIWAADVALRWTARTLSPTL